PGRPDEVIAVPDVAPAIVTAEEQARIQDRFAVSKAEARRNNKNAEAALLRAGFIHCGHCGKTCTVVNQASTRSASPYYRCGARSIGPTSCVVPTMSTRLIDEAVWQQVSAVLRNPAIIEAEVTRRRDDGGLERDLAALDKRIAALADKQRRLTRRI